MKILKELSSIKSQKDIFAFLADKQNKQEIIREKKDVRKFTDSIFMPFIPDFLKEINSQKAAIELNEGEIMIVGNSVGFMDSHLDVSLRGSWTKTVKERGNRVPILKDHNYSVDSLFAENLGAFVMDVPISSLGYKKSGGTEILGAKIKPNAEMLEKYQKGIVKEHSVGLQYIKLALAINDPQDEEGYKEWLSNIDKVINREVAEERGYFYPIYEQKLIEFSAVVFGSNPYTPAFSQDKSLEEIEPLQDTQIVEPKEKEKQLSFYQLLNQKL